MWNPLLRAARLSGTSCDWIPLAELRCELVDAVSWRDLIWPLKVHGQVLARGAAMEIYNAELGASSMTMSLGAKPRLLFLYQGFAILMGLASMVAALPVAALFCGYPVTTRGADPANPERTGRQEIPELRPDDCGCL